MVYREKGVWIVGLLNISPKQPVYAREGFLYQLLKGMVKKDIQQGRRLFFERSVRLVREHEKMARTPLVDFFNIPIVI